MTVFPKSPLTSTPFAFLFFVKYHSFGERVCVSGQDEWFDLGEKGFLRAATEFVGGIDSRGTVLATHQRACVKILGPLDTDGLHTVVHPGREWLGVVRVGNLQRTTLVVKSVDAVFGRSIVRSMVCVRGSEVNAALVQRENSVECVAAIVDCVCPLLQRVAGWSGFPMSAFTKTSR